jgi:dihydrodipicolinate synthase/N-acetylneuraminate lyase
MLAGGLREGNAVLLVNGAAGEFPVLNAEERRQTAETVVRAAGDVIAVIVGAQATGLQAAAAPALPGGRHAIRSGVAMNLASVCAASQRYIIARMR